jgi:hypothetical protein
MEALFEVVRKAPVVLSIVVIAAPLLFCGTYAAATDNDTVLFVNTADISELGAIEIINPSEKDIRFRFSVNERGLFKTSDEIIAFIETMPEEYPGESMIRKVWRFTRSFRYHNVPLAEHCWYSSNPLTMFNSLGFGFCGEAAAMNYILWSKLGYPVRYWDLGGIHVVSEVFHNGRWEMYDSDCEVYYLNRENLVAGVEELAMDTTLITEPLSAFTFDTLNVFSLSPPAANYAYQYAYSRLVATAYAGPKISSEDPERQNTCRYVNYMEPPNGYDDELILPPGGKIKIWDRRSAPLVVSPYNRDAGWEIEYFASLSLTIPAGWKGTLPFLPLIVHSISGSGTITIPGNNGMRYFVETLEIGSFELNSLLESYWSPTGGMEVDAVGDVTIEFLINPLWFNKLPYNLLSLSGEGVEELQVNGFVRVEDPDIKTADGSDIICFGGLELNATHYGALDYVWYYNGEIIAGEESSNIIAYKEGNYHVRIRTPSGRYVGQSPPIYLRDFAIPEIEFPQEVYAFPDESIDLSEDIKEYMLEQDAGFELQWMHYGEKLGAPRTLSNTELIPTRNGLYQAVVSSDYCTQVSNPFYVVLMNENYSVNGVNVRFFPNPFVDKFYLEFIPLDNNSGKMISAWLHDSYGREIWRVDHSMADQKYEIEVDGFGPPSGLYLLEVDVGGERRTIKLIKR